MSPDTTDFTPIFNGIEAKKPDVIITGISHVGVQPTVQWANQQVPIPMFGISSQATSTTFWKDTNGATEGVVLQLIAFDTVATTPKTIPFGAAYTKKYGFSPAYSGYGAYDDVYLIADAIHRAGGTDPDKMVTALEATDYVGTVGRIQFYGKDDPFTHAMKYGPDYVSGLVVQWQDGKQVAVWPRVRGDGGVEVSRVREAYELVSMPREARPGLCPAPTKGQPSFGNPSAEGNRDSQGPALSGSRAEPWPY